MCYLAVKHDHITISSLSFPKLPFPDSIQHPNGSDINKLAVDFKKILAGLIQVKIDEKPGLYILKTDKKRSLAKDVFKNMSFRLPDCSL